MKEEIQGHESVRDGRTVRRTDRRRRKQYTRTFFRKCGYNNQEYANNRYVIKWRLLYDNFTTQAIHTMLHNLISK